MRRTAAVLSVLCLLLLLASLASSERPAIAQGSESPRIRVSVTPPTLPADGGSYQAIFIQLQGPTGDVIAAPQDVQLILTSSNLAVGTVQSPVTMQRGQAYVSAVFITSLTPGSTNITVSATGLVPSSAIVTSVPYGKQPTKLAVYVAPTTVFADGSSSYYFFVQLQDAAGLPSQEANPTSIAVTSSAPGVVSLQPNMLIPSGGSFASSQFSTGLTSGNATITAQLNGMQSGSLALRTVYLPLTVKMDAPAAAALVPLSDARIGVSVTSGGLPLSGASVSWSHDSKSSSWVNSSASTDANGIAYGTLHMGAAGNITVTALVSKNGYGAKTVSSRLAVVALPLSVVLVAGSTFLNATLPTDVTAIVTSKGRPVQGAQLSWSSTLGAVNPPASTTDASGKSKVSFVSPTDGNATVSVTVSAQGYASGSGTATITISGPSSISGAGFLSGGVGSVVPFIAIVPVLAVIGFLLMRRRRASKKAPKEAEGAEETETADLEDV